MISAPKLVSILVLIVGSIVARAGECVDPAGCSTPCPAEHSCRSAEECAAGEACEPACLPSYCRCDTGSWICTEDCAGVCCGDLDADGVCDGYDNCPYQQNPGQEDCDGDGVGDACEGCPCDPYDDLDADLICAPPDNCPFVANTDQTDTDVDGLGDACDCGPLDPSAGLPGEVASVLAHASGGGTTWFTWGQARFADRYDVLRGGPDTGGLDCATSEDSDPTDLEFGDLLIPQPGALWLYLVRGIDDGCGGPGTWGQHAVAGNCP